MRLEPTNPFGSPLFPGETDIPQAFNIRSNIELPSLPSLKDHTLADTMYERLESQIQDLQQELAADQQLKIWYQKSGFQYQVLSLGYHNPHLIVLYAVDESATPSRILVHMNSLELVLKVEPTQEGQPRRTIGFAGPIEKPTEPGPTQPSNPPNPA